MKYDENGDGFLSQQEYLEAKHEILKDPLKEEENNYDIYDEYEIE